MKLKFIVRAMVVVATLHAQTAQYPGSLATPQNLKVALNGVSTLLAADISSAVTTFAISNCAGIVPYTLITIDQEIMNVTGCSGTTIIVDTRGFDNTNAVAHVAGSVIYANVDAWHHNSLSAEVQAIESTLGVNLSNVTGKSAIPVVAHNGAYAIAASDQGNALTSNVAAAYTLPQAGSAGFPDGWMVYVQNVGGSGNVTVTTTVSTFYGNLGSGSVGTLTPNTGVQLVSNGTNWLVNSYTQGPDAGSGTVTSVATTGPITGGTITTTGTIGCATCVAASSPGAGVAHFAGSTQTVTSSAVAPSDTTAQQGNGSKFQLSTGSTTTNDCVKFDVNGNTVDAGSGCGGSSASIPFMSSGTPVSGSPATGGINIVPGTGVIGTPTVVSTVATLQYSADIGYLSTQLGINAVNAQTGATYTIAASDKSKLVTFANAGSVAVTLPQGTGSFAAPFAFGVTNIGPGTVTITPTTSTINGAATLVLATGQSYGIITDPGGNYQLYGGGSSYNGATTITSPVVPVLGTAYQNTTGKQITAVAGGFCSTADRVISLLEGATSSPTLLINSNLFQVVSTFNQSIAGPVPVGYWYKFIEADGGTDCTINDGAIMQ